MFDVNQGRAITLTSALAEWEAGNNTSCFDAIREIRLAHSLVTEGERSPRNCARSWRKHR